MMDYDYDTFVEYVEEIYKNQEIIKELGEEMENPMSFADARNYKQETERQIQHAKNEISNLAAQVVNKFGLPMNRWIAADEFKVAFGGGYNTPPFAKVEEK